MVGFWVLMAWVPSCEFVLFTCLFVCLFVNFSVRQCVCDFIDGDRWAFFWRFICGCVGDVIYWNLVVMIIVIVFLLVACFVCLCLESVRALFDSMNDRSAASIDLGDVECWQSFCHVQKLYNVSPASQNNTLASWQQHHTLLINPIMKTNNKHNFKWMISCNASDAKNTHNKRK